MTTTENKINGLTLLETEDHARLLLRKAHGTELTISEQKRLTSYTIISHNEIMKYKNKFYL